MPAVRVKVKHAGKIYDDDKLVCNTDLPPTAFKQSIYERTGVPLERMKVMVKGGTLKVSYVHPSIDCIQQCSMWRMC